MTSQTNGITRKYMYVGDIGGLKPEQRWTANKMIENQVFRRTTILDLAFNQIGSSYKPKDAWEKMKGHDDICKHLQTFAEQKKSSRNSEEQSVIPST